MRCIRGCLSFDGKVRASSRLESDSLEFCVFRKAACIYAREPALLLFYAFIVLQSLVEGTSTIFADDAAKRATLFPLDSSLDLLSF